MKKMRCAYCNSIYDYNKENFPILIMAQCKRCLQEEQEKKLLYRLKSKKPLYELKKWWNNFWNKLK